MKSRLTENSVLYASYKYIGDLNGDNEINTKDAVFMAQFLAGWDVEIDPDVLDCNGDGETNTKDAVILAQYLAGWNVTLG